MYKRGDIVRIKYSLHSGNDYQIFCNSDMAKLRGQITKVKKVCSNYAYLLEIDHGNFFYSSDMLTCVPKDRHFINIALCIE